MKIDVACERKTREEKRKSWREKLYTKKLQNKDNL